MVEIRNSVTMHVSISGEKSNSDCSLVYYAVICGHYNISVMTNFNVRARNLHSSARIYE